VLEKVKYIAKYKLWCTPEKKQYFAAYLFENKNDMWNYEKSNLIVDFDCSYKALCHPFQRLKLHNGREIFLSDIGVVLLQLNDISASVVSHELLHAAFHWFKLNNSDTLKSLNDSMDKEEEFCHCHSYMTRQFWCKFYSRFSVEYNGEIIDNRKITLDKNQ
jgi:hypothetical protein